MPPRSGTGALHQCRGQGCLGAESSGGSGCRACPWSRQPHSKAPRHGVLVPQGHLACSSSQVLLSPPPRVDYPHVTDVDAEM